MNSGSVIGGGLNGNGGARQEINVMVAGAIENPSGNPLVINGMLAGLIRPVTAFFPDPFNVNEHTTEGVAGIADSLKEYGQMRAIIVRSDGMIACGNGTYQAALKLGATHIAAMVDDEHSVADLARFAISDNKTKDASSLSEDRLAAFVKSMRETNPLAKLPGFSMEMLNQLATKAVGTVSGEGQGTDRERAKTIVPSALDSVPVRSETGDVWQCGDHRVMCGDSTKPGDLLALMWAEKASMVWSDPPYGIEYQSHHYGNREGGNPHTPIENDAVLLDFVPPIMDFCISDCAVYVCAAHQNAHEWRLHLDKDLTYKNAIIWKKNNWSMGDLSGAYAGQYELIFFYHHGRPLLKDGRDRDVWDCDRVPPTYHPTTKPFELVARAIKNSTCTGDIVLDPFGGSGPSLVACEAEGRCARIMESNPRYVDVMLEWYKAYSSEAPVLKLRGGVAVEAENSDE